MTNYLITRRPRRIAPISLLPKQHHVTANQLIDRLEPVIGPIEFDAEADRESTWEELFRLDAALRTFPRERTWISTRNHRGISTPQHLAGSENPTTFDVRWGPDAGSVRRHHETDDEVFPYWNYQAFAKASGRPMEVCGYGLEDDPRDVTVIGERLGRLSETPGRIFVKGTGTKMFAGAARILTTYGSPMLTFDDEWVDAGLWRYEGSADCMLAQPYVDMIDEYRFFVVHGQLMAGSAKIQEFLPFENTQRFDQHFKKDGTLVQRPDLVETYKAFAQSVASELCEEDPKLTDYVMDIATGPNGPLVVELNMMGAAGFFRVNPMDVAQGYFPAV